MITPGCKLWRLLTGRSSKVPHHVKFTLPGFYSYLYNYYNRQYWCVSVLSNVRERILSFTSLFVLLHTLSLLRRTLCEVTKGTGIYPKLLTTSLGGPFLLPPFEVIVIIIKCLFLPSKHVKGKTSHHFRQEAVNTKLNMSCFEVY